MKILAVNAGSSSLKFMLIRMPEEMVLTSGIVEKIGSQEAIFSIKINERKQTKNCFIASHLEAVELILNSLLENKIINNLSELSGIGHRVVQGGEKCKESKVIDNKLINVIMELSDIAPLHNPANLMGINTFKKLLPNSLNVAVFDNSFHLTMKEDAFLYAIPYEWYKEYGIRKYGYHGTSHQFVSQRASVLLGKKNAKIIVCHLGNGASICAVKNQKSIDTSMGFTPLEGIPMGTRSGNIDPGIIEYICKKLSKDEKQVTSILNRGSGFLGVSGFSNDARDITKKYKENDKRAMLAFDIYAKRIVDYIGSYFLSLGGLDAICFTAGIGENSPLIRELVLNRLKALKIKFDNDLNYKTFGVETMLSLPNSKVKIYVIPTNEEVMIAREVYKHATKK